MPPIEPTPPEDSDLAATETSKTLRAIAETARRARHEGPSLPHPYETDAKFSALLDQATRTSSGGGAGLRSKVERAVLALILPGQVAFNRNVVELFHQLDHRDRQQREEIADLRRELDARP